MQKYGIQDRANYGAGGWHTKTPAEADGFDLSTNDYTKVGYRFTDDDASAIVWLYDTRITDLLANATWDAIDDTVGEPLILYNFAWYAYFPNATSYPEDKRKTRDVVKRDSDIWDDGAYIPVPWSNVSVSVSQETCPTAQNFTTIAVDANGNTIANVTGVNSNAFTILEDEAYPVTIYSYANVGNITAVISNLLPIKFALGDGSNGIYIPALNGNTQS